MLVVPFATRNGSNEQFAKTNRPLACCLQNCPGGSFYMGLAPAQNMPTRLGSGQSMTCGRTSAIAARRLPTRRLHIVSAFSRRRLLVALWPNALLLHERWGQPAPSSCGFAATASTSGSPARLCGDSNARPLLHICDTSRTAACARHSRRSSIDRQLQRKRSLWPTRLTSGAGRTHWPRSNAAKSRPNALRRRQRERWPWSNAAESWPNRCSDVRESVGCGTTPPRVGQTLCGDGGESIDHGATPPRVGQTRCGDNGESVGRRTLLPRVGQTRCVVDGFRVGRGAKSLRVGRMRSGIG
jgi:hypothetical protein